MRRLIAFPCDGETLVGSLDEAPGETGLLIVSGGNEPRMGAHRGMALLAARVAAQGWAVFRFDRRGVGDSEGTNGGWTSSAPDLAAAADAFRETGVKQLVGFGNCDAATALALFGAAAGVDRLLLANPWVVERTAGEPLPPAAIRARYAERLRSPRSWTRGVNIAKLIKGLATLSKPRSEYPLAHRFAAAVRSRDVTILLAAGDATALAYADAVRDLGIAAPVVRIATASHSFAGPETAAALERAIVSALGAAARAAE